MVDVVSRRCEETDCRRRPLYGHEGEKGRFCSYHKVMIQFCRDECNNMLALVVPTVWVHGLCVLQPLLS